MREPMFNRAAGTLVWICAWAFLRFVTADPGGGVPEGAPTPPEATVARGEYLPGEVVVKFRTASGPAQALSAARVEKVALARVSLSAEFDKVANRYKVQEITPVFGDFEVRDFSGKVTKIETMHEHMVRVAGRLGEPRPSEEDALEVPDLTTVYALKLPDDADVMSAVAEFSRCDGVEYAEPAWIYHASGPPDPPSDPYWGTQDTWHQTYDDLWGLKRIGCMSAWSHCTGAGVVVAVLDTGVDFTHEDIVENLWINEDEDLNRNGRLDWSDLDLIDDDWPLNGYRDDVVGYNFVTRGQYVGWVADDNGHGTHVAGTIAATGYNEVGVIGVAFDARLMILKALDASLQGSPDKLARAITYARDNGAKVINCSWGGPSWSWTISNAIDYAGAGAQGVLVVCAAGNPTPEEPRGSYYQFPARHPKTIAVGATNYGYEGAQNERRSSFSRLGPMLDVCAPGGDHPWPNDPPGYPRVDILSLQAWNLDPLSAQYGQGTCVVSPGYYRMNGTSMACPHVSGFAALVRSAYPDLSAQEVRGMIAMTAKDLGLTGRDDAHGFGRIDASNALDPYIVAPVRCEGWILNPIPDLVNPWSYYGYIDITGAAKGAEFSSWKLEWTNNLGRTWNLISQGTTPKQEGETLGRFYDNGLPDAEYIFRLTVKDTRGRSFEHRSSVMELDGWHGGNFVFPLQHLDAAPAVADMDPYNPGPPNIAVGTWNFSSTSQGTFGVVTPDPPSFNQFAEMSVGGSSPAIVNIDGYTGGPPQIVVACFYNPSGESGVFCYDASGGERWRFLRPEYFWTSPAVADIDPNSYGLETAVVSGERLYVLDSYGELLWDWDGSPGQDLTFDSAPTISDLGGQGKKVIVVAMDFTSGPDGFIAVLNADGSVYWSQTLPDPGSWVQYSCAAVGQLDGYGMYEIVFGAANGKLYCFHGEGLPWWEFNAGAPIHTSPAIASLCNNGLTPQVVFPADNGKVYCLNRDGSVCWQFDTGGGPIRSSPAIAPVWGYSSVIIGSGNSRLYFINGYYGAVMRVFRLFANVTGSPVVADMNSSSPGLEFVVGFDDGRLLLLNSEESAWCPAGATPWPTFHHDNARTGCYDGWY